VVSIFINKCLKKENSIIFGDRIQAHNFVSVRYIIQANILSANSKNADKKSRYGKGISIMKLL
jgi:nucleoside-diphosphate-sugar epimerase